MAITKVVLKKVRQQAIVKLVGDGTANIDFHDALLSDEVYGGAGNCRMNINSVIFTNGAATPIVVSRNGSNVMILNGNDNWSFSQMMGFVESANNNGNIAVTIPTPGGTIYFGLTKVAGFETANNNQELKDYQKI